MRFKAPFGSEPASTGRITCAITPKRLGGRPTLTSPPTPSATVSEMDPLPRIPTVEMTPGHQTTGHSARAGLTAALLAPRPASRVPPILIRRGTKAQVAMVTGLSHVIPAPGGQRSRPDGLAGHRRPTRRRVSRVDVAPGPVIATPSAHATPPSAGLRPDA